MPIDNNRLIKEQIENIQNEILLINFVFSFVNTLSLFLLGLIFQRIASNVSTSDDTYLKFLEAAAALFAPYLAIVTQGFYYPRWRKLNSLRHLLFKETLSDDELNFIYDKQ